LFLEGVKAYLNKQDERLEIHYKDLSQIENEADELRRDIKYKLYTYSLIPESRGDVLGLIETLDDVVDISKKYVEQLMIERPFVPDCLEELLYNIAELSQKAVEELVRGTRAFFIDIRIVNDYVNKVHFYEHEVDKLEEVIKRKIFSGSEIENFSQKTHLRFFVERLAELSDVAEGVAERLSIYAIKRSL
jgi:predicted phosphate transport protein (TIGR00153 family)